MYLDESGFAQSMPRIHGYSEKGLRCFGTHDWYAKGRINVIGAIRENTFVTLSVFAGNINADVFHA
ncbi:transposase [Xenorhabdus khoisanae]|uniref:transposase n=1 Tax=Xenorhabdus khoisanae TaxID=880157 RepID=UPI003B586D56